MIGRINEDVAAERAHGVLQAAFTNFRRDDARLNFGPSDPPDEVARFINTPLYVRSATTGPSPLRRQFQRPLWILATIAALVLLIAGSNIANLFLARTAAREREMSLRLSLGAGRGRLIQQMLVESALIAGPASLIGMIFAGVRRASDRGDAGVDRRPGVARSARRLAARRRSRAALTLLMTALFGLVPALRASTSRR